MNNFVTYNEDGVKWVIRNSYADKIIRLLKDNPTTTRNPQSEIYNLQSTVPVAVIKSNPVRTVKTIAINDKDVLYLKHYKCKGWRDMVKFTIFESKARREWKNGYEILERGICTGEPVAYGEKRGKLFVSDNFLLIKSIAESEPINNVLSDENSKSALGFKKRRELLKGLSHFIIKLHSNGVLHKDLHAGNILVNSKILDSRILDYTSIHFANHEKDVQNVFSIIDLHDVRCKRQLSWRTRMKNLARHLYSLTPYCSRSELFFVMNVYLQSCLKDQVRKRSIKDINKLIIGFKHRHISSRSKRCMKNSSGFSVKSWKKRDHSMCAEYRGYLRRSYNREIIEEAIRIHNEAKRLNPDYVIKDTSKIFITVFYISSNDNKSVKNGFHGKICVKEYKNSGIFRQFRESVSSSRGKKTWRAVNGFVVRKLVTPMPISFVEMRRWGLLKNSLIITEYVEPATLVYFYVANCLDTSLEIKEGESLHSMEKNNELKSSASDKIMRKRDFIEAFSRSFKNIHKQGVYHADLKGGNILVKEIGEKGWEFFYLDLDRVSFKKSVTKREIIKNLTQLNASLPNEFSFSDRMRFYKNYSGKNRLDRGDKLLLKKIIVGSIKRGHFWNPKKIKLLNC